MKKNYILAALAVVVTASLFAQTKPTLTTESAVALQQIRMGHETIQGLRQSFDASSYDAFLANLHSDYLKMAQSDKFSEFIKMREAAPVDEKLKKLAQHWEELHQKLIAERNEELKSASIEKDEVLFKQVQSIIQQLPPDQKEALQYITSLRFKTPDMAVNDDEKKLIEIDLSAEFKIVHLDAQYVQKPFDDRMEKHIVINMDMIRQMLEASKSFKDSNLQKKVRLASLGFDTWQARNWDLNLLNQVIKTPKSDSERIIAAIIEKYQTKRADLYQKEFLAKLDH